MGSLSLAEQILERPDAVLQLQSLTRALEAEKKRRQDFYLWVTEDIKAEFINGQVILHSPVKKRHWNVTDLLSRVMSFYASLKKLGRVGTEKVMIALTRNDYEPDLVFFSKEKADQFTDDQVLFPAPDFAVEILSKSTAATDRGTKKDDYAAHGIREYWIIDPVKQRIEQYILASASTAYFPPKIHQSTDFIQSVVLPGFEIPVMAIFDEATNLETLKGMMG